MVSFIKAIQSSPYPINASKTQTKLHSYTLTLPGRRSNAPGQNTSRVLPTSSIDRHLLPTISTTPTSIMAYHKNPIGGVHVSRELNPYVSHVSTILSNMSANELGRRCNPMLSLKTFPIQPGCLGKRPPSQSCSETRQEFRNPMIGSLVSRFSTGGVVGSFLKMWEAKIVGVEVDSWGPPPKK